MLSLKKYIFRITQDNERASVVRNIAKLREHQQFFVRMPAFTEADFGKIILPFNFVDGPFIRYIEFPDEYKGRISSWEKRFDLQLVRDPDHFSSVPCYDPRRRYLGFDYDPPDSSFPPGMVSFYSILTRRPAFSFYYFC